MIRRGSPPEWGSLPSEEESLAAELSEVISPGNGERTNIDLAFRYFMSPSLDEKLSELKDNGAGEIFCLPLDIYSSPALSDHPGKVSSEDGLGCINIAEWEGYPLGVKTLADTIKSLY